MVTLMTANSNRLSSLNFTMKNKCDFILIYINHYHAKVIYLNFQPLVSRYRDPQLRVGETTNTVKYVSENCANRDV